MKSLLDSIKETWNKLSRPLQIGVGVFVLGVFISLLFLALFARTDYQVLFSGLAPEDAGVVVTTLQDRGIDYQLADGGTTILVPEKEVFETRISLATAGMPTGGVVGFEIFNSTRLGETEADRQLRYQWALQGELTRTIRQINEIADARIHIVLPKRSLFVQESQAATASVLLQLNPGAQLNKSQVRAIANLVSTSVEGLTPDNVTIVDSKGSVLNSPALAELGGDITDRFETQWLYEQQLERSIVAMLERIYGFGNVITRVNANLDFAKLEEYSEVYSPSNRGEGLVRSTQNFEENYQGIQEGSGGIPGVDSNVPGYVFMGAQGGTTEWDRSENTTNYELNRTETRSTVLPGGVNNLNVSVWINGELTPVELASIEESVIRATGLVLTRGDSIHVASALFDTDSFLTEPPLMDVVQGVSILWLVGLGLLILILILVLVFTLLRKRQKEELVPAAAAIDLLVDDEEIPEEKLTPEERERRDMRQSIKDLAKDKPEELALLMKTWLMDE